MPCIMYRTPGTDHGTVTCGIDGDRWAGIHEHDMIHHTGYRIQDTGYMHIKNSRPTTSSNRRRSCSHPQYYIPFHSIPSPSSPSLLSFPLPFLSSFIVELKTAKRSSQGRPCKTRSDTEDGDHSRLHIRLTCLTA